MSSKITADGDCNHEIKRHLLLNKSYDKPRQCIKKHRQYFAHKRFIGWRVLTNCGPLEKGMATHLSILALRTP